VIRIELREREKTKTEKEEGNSLPIMISIDLVIMEREIFEILTRNGMSDLIANKALDELLNLYSVMKCDNSDHNMLIDYDGACGYCKGTTKK